MRGINHQNIFEEKEDYYQLLTTLDVMAQSYDPDGTPSGRNYVLYAYCLMTNHIHLLIRERENTGATNSSAFQQLPDETKGSMLIELKGRRASLRQLERLTGIGKSMIYRM
jgi:REP element-mobilizing transposase RayT